MKKIYALLAGIVLSISAYSQCSVSIGGIVTPTCNGDCDGSATATPSGFTLSVSYSWSTSPAQTTQTATNLCAGTYTVTATDGICTATQTVAITEPAQLVATSTHTDVSCFGGSDGTATAAATGGTPNYSYSWNTAPVQNTQTATNLTPGMYTCTVTDQNGCSATTVATITEPTALSSAVSGTNISCLNGSDGTATATPSGGTTPYTYSWNTSPAQTTQTATGLSAGTYLCQVTDANGCATSVSITLTQPATAVTITTSATMASCNGNCDGTAMVSATGGTGPHTYMWSPGGDSTQTITGLCAGDYVVTVMDSLGCTVMDTVSVAQPQVLMSNVTVMNATCNGFCDGIAMASPTGGTAPYMYSWTSGATTQSDSGLCAGTQGVIVTDSNGCTHNQIVTLTEPAAIVATATGTDASCIGCQNGSATVTATGGNGVYTYLWTPGNQTTATASGLGLGTYVVCVSDSNGCPSGCDTVFINDGTGISGVSSVYNINVYPNPADNELNIAINSTSPVSVQIILFDVTGREVIAQNLGAVMSANKTLDLSNQSSGVYFLEVNVDGQKSTTKIIRN